MNNSSPFANNIANKNIKMNVYLEDGIEYLGVHYLPSQSGWCVFTSDLGQSTTSIPDRRIKRIETYFDDSEK